MHNDPQVAELRRRIVVSADPDAPEGGQAHLTVRLKDGRVLEKHTPFVRGTPRDPMTMDEVVRKARGIMEPVMREKTGPLIDALLSIGAEPDLSRLSSLLRNDAG
jgi:2-methylcitrate dehydratase PrpD